MYNHLFNFPRNELKKTSNQVGLTLLIVFGLEIILSLFTKLLKLSSIQNINARNLLYFSIEVIITLLALFLPFIILSLITDPHGDNNPIPFKKNSFSTILFAVIICMGVTYVAQILTIIFQIATNAQPPDYHHGTTTIGIIAENFAVALIPAIIEEIIYRGIILGMFRKYGNTFAISFSALLFALSHMNFAQIVCTFIMGMVFGFITIKLNSLLPAIIAHMLNNLFYVLINVNIMSPIAYHLILFFTLILSVIIIIFKSINNKKLFKISDNPTYHISDTQKLKSACSAPATLTFIIISGIFATVYYIIQRYV